MKNEFKFVDNDLDIAYILGIYMTDGHVSKAGAFSLISIDKDICETFQVSFFGLSGINREVKATKKKYKGKDRHYWSISTHRHELFNWLVRVTDAKMTLPRFVYNQSSIWQKEFIAGLLDGDGWITWATNRYETSKERGPSWYCQVGLVGTTKSYINQIPRFFDHLGIRHSINITAPKKSGYKEQTRILIKPESFFQNGLYFNCKRKQNKAITVYSTYNERKPPNQRGALGYAERYRDHRNDDPPVKKQVTKSNRAKDT